MAGIEKIIKEEDLFYLSQRGYDESGREYYILIKDNKKIKTVYDNKYCLGDFFSPTIGEFLIITFESGFYSPLSACMLDLSKNTIYPETFILDILTPKIIIYTSGRLIEIFSKGKLKESIKKAKQQNKNLVQCIRRLST